MSVLYLYPKMVCAPRPSPEDNDPAQEAPLLQAPVRTEGRPLLIGEEPYESVIRPLIPYLSRLPPPAWFQWRDSFLSLYCQAYHQTEEMIPILRETLDTLCAPVSPPAPKEKKTDHVSQFCKDSIRLLERNRGETPLCFQDRKEKSTITGKEMYARYTDWCLLHGRDPLKPSHLHTAVSKLFPLRDKKGGVITYYGLLFREGSRTEPLRAE